MELPSSVPPEAVHPDQVPVVLPDLDRNFFGLVFSTPGEPYLMLPADFVRRHMNPCPKVITLSNTVDHRPWTIVLQQDSDGMYFGRGWAAFRDAYRIRPDYILNFAYDNDTHFDVSPLGLNSMFSLTRPPTVNLNLAPPGAIVRTRTPVNPVVVLDDDPRREYVLQDGDEIGFVGFSIATTCGRCGNLRNEEASKRLIRKRQRSNQGGLFIGQRTIPFCPHFYTELKKEDVTHPCKLDIKWAFAVRYLPAGKCFRTLRVKGIGNYVVQVTRRETSAIMSVGFTSFVRACGLEQGDRVCFEECRRDMRIWTVTIRKKQDADDEPVYIN